MFLQEDSLYIRVDTDTEEGEEITYTAYFRTKEAHELALRAGMLDEPDDKFFWPLTAEALSIFHELMRDLSRKAALCRFLGQPFEMTPQQRTRRDLLVAMRTRFLGRDDEDQYIPRLECTVNTQQLEYRAVSPEVWKLPVMPEDGVDLVLKEECSFGGVRT